MPKNIGLYNDNLSVPRKSDVDSAVSQAEQNAERQVANHNESANPHANMGWVTGSDLTASNVSFMPGSTGMSATDVQGAVTELFTSVSDGKSAIAAAITDKGVTTAADATFQQMAANVEAIQTSSVQSVNLHVTNNISTQVTIYIKRSGDERYSGINVFSHEEVDYEIEYGGAIFVLGPSRYGRFTVRPSGGLDQVFADEGRNTGSYVLFFIHLYGDPSITFDP